MRFSLIYFVIFLLPFNSFFSQKNSLTIISSNNLDFNDLANLKEIITFVNEQKVNVKFNLKYKNYLDQNGDFLDLVNQKSVDYIDTNFINDNYKDIDEIKNAIEKEYVGKFCIQYVKPYLTKGKLSLEINDYLSSDIIELKKWIKKNKNSKQDVFIFWNNGYQPYKYSPEFIAKIIQQYKSGKITNQIIPKITKPDTSITNVLRPDESHYKIEFDHGGLFPKYQIQISKKYKDGDSIIIFDECLDFISSKEFNDNKRDKKFALFTKNSKKCVFAISQAELGYRCLQYDKLEKVENIDPECDCQFDCLYHNRFSLTIRGCVDGLEETEIPSSFVKKVMFQCNATD